MYVGIQKQAFGTTNSVLRMEGNTIVSFIRSSTVYLRQSILLVTTNFSV